MGAGRLGENSVADKRPAQSLSRESHGPSRPLLSRGERCRQKGRHHAGRGSSRVRGKRGLRRESLLGSMKKGKKCRRALQRKSDERFPSIIFHRSTELQELRKSEKTRTCLDRAALLRNEKGRRYQSSQGGREKASFSLRRSLKVYPSGVHLSRGSLLFR